MRRFPRSVEPSYQVPEHLFQPLWLRSLESLANNHLVYDPIAASACQRCQIKTSCPSQQVQQKQLLYSSLTHMLDQQIRQFLELHPTAWVINVGAGLDTRFYRLDNGLCHWLELDNTEHLIWRNKLFHRSERYSHQVGSVECEQWLDFIHIPEHTPVMIICEQSLLSCPHPQIARFVQSLARRFEHAQLCAVLAGDLCDSSIGRKLGTESYAHGYRDMKRDIVQFLPWLETISVRSPLDSPCQRWKVWQRMLSKLPSFKCRFTPVVVQINW